ncbi:AcCoA-C-Actrans: acetyl-CoA C-acetyltransferase [Rubrobacter radiotolerans]|uniref:acetyl-CoA C-acyltransferase n=1 Tax=Rubrobacter radiotolerans TaxID=42256 RepID=A0A023X4K6_RUBRA|nr:acetyl-CoA C-acyltransferase [Rubrobacter radiotolerans]AHY47121.1 AcCoA-C-Actrans: acetyl-CoA C-acetyltransferase [Rubrobacter radiotolerans]MDX5894526.1 acetyl-CoA C-acyltransferase [Rubrobacter radiotolerans]SMC06191.1 acetyl-CoA acyltransferase [Rubrobacter radiotolerans DSM 5868]
MREAVIVGGARTAVGRAPRGTLRGSMPDDMAAAAIRAAIERSGGVEPEEIEDVILGCAIPEGTQGNNIARQSALLAGLPETVPAQTVNRFCSSGLQTIATAAERIMVGNAKTIVAGGTEHMSTTINMPLFAPNPKLLESNPAVYMGMGLTGEQVAREFKVSREDQDEFALRSHTLAQEAVNSGRFDEEIVPLDVNYEWVDENGEVQHKDVTFSRDEGPRDTSMEKLAKLPTVFQQGGTVTAGNSSQRSDGAAAVVVMDREEAERRGLTPLARFVGFAVGGVRPEVMGVGPTVAIPKVLEQTGLTLDDIDLIEFNEAFAAQALAVIREVGMDLEKTNVNGGAIALGHPMGATGTKLTVQLMSEMKRRNSRYGMVTMCIGGGMGAAGIFENLQN